MNEPTEIHEKYCIECRICPNCRHELAERYRRDLERVQWVTLVECSICGFEAETQPRERRKLGDTS